MAERASCFAFTDRMVPEVGIAPTSPRLQRGANLPQLLGGACARPKMVVPAGNAPASSGYQPGALLLSYRTEEKWSNREQEVEVGLQPTHRSRTLPLQSFNPGTRRSSSCGSGFRCVHDDPMPERQRD